MRFIWLPCHDEESRKKEVDSKVDPYEWGTEGFAGFDDSGESEKAKYRAVCGYHVKRFICLHEWEINRSLGLIINELPVSYFRGNVALAASSLTIEDGEVDTAPIDTLPCDLPKVLQRLAREELSNESNVKMEMSSFYLSEDGDEVEFGEEHCQQQ